MSEKEHTTLTEENKTEHTGEASPEAPSEEGGAAEETPSVEEVVAEATEEVIEADIEEPPLSPEEEAFLASLPEDPDELRLAALELKRSADENLDAQRRTLAEFANYRKRVNQEAGTSRERGKVDMLETLLPVLDDIDQGVQNTANSSPEQMAKGLSMLQQKVRQLLNGQGIEVIDPTGEAFDPNIADALATAPNPEFPPNTVAQTFSPCYRHKEQVIRAAKVVVTPGEEESAT